MTTVEALGALFMVDGDVWRVCCVDETGADLHKVNHWQTKHLTPEQWLEFTDQYKTIGKYE